MGIDAQGAAWLISSEKEKKAVPKTFLLDSPYWFGEREEHASI
ncbi:hypothetical protein GTCCBUS3UF5_9970 [Geobacillus thermoleovorans CCB_US3_UF5]|uniref:Uncharacterized protein n=2 Tax=Geobacillus TaxID=129337 RepID=A0A1Q5SYZ7_9BACL|nr:hypothetical protein GTCCBUS3UF5_9970 [Geobacillus thermoleovorans CCB_US3_UF5]OKO93180.1 hypothetical protein BRO54_2012 [Geobacillus proteiniphilus]GAJ59852.1 hypothetical protein B23_3078 [Geobacillus thermoleovorans B23]